MNLKTQKKIASKVLKCSPKRVVFDNANSEDIKEAITRADIKRLVGSKIVAKAKKDNNSRSRIRKNLEQKRKGRQSGQGSRKGKHGARVTSKSQWIAKVRLQREFIKELKDKAIVSQNDYRNLYAKVKGGYFRNKRHIKLYIEEAGLVQNK